MLPIRIDPRRLQAVQDIAGRERAAQAAAAARLNDVTAESHAIGREILAVQRRYDPRGDATVKARLEGLQRQRQAKDGEILEASAQLEDAQARLSTASRLRHACEAYVRSAVGGASHGR